MKNPPNNKKQNKNNSKYNFIQKYKFIEKRIDFLQIRLKIKELIT